MGKFNQSIITKVKFVLEVNSPTKLQSGTKKNMTDYMSMSRG